MSPTPPGADASDTGSSDTGSSEGVPSTPPQVPDSVDDELFRAAVEARTHSYSPYSGYRVGVALRTTDGSVFVGCNVENAAYPEGVCAEGGAISAMVVGSTTTPVIETVVVVTEGETPGTPCGGCRQKIREFAGPTTTISSCTLDGLTRAMSVEEILPASFGPDHLS